MPINLAAKFNMKLRLDYFDPPEQQPYKHIKQDAVDTDEARQLALESAQEILMQGSYYGKAPFLIDPVTTFKDLTEGKSIEVEFSYGCQISDSDQNSFVSATQLAQSSDIVIFFGGIDSSIEGEDHDRTSIALPTIQLSLLKQLEYTTIIHECSKWLESGSYQIFIGQQYICTIELQEKPTR